MLVQKKVKAQEWKLKKVQLFLGIIALLQFVAVTNKTFQAFLTGAGGYQTDEWMGVQKELNLLRHLRAREFVSNYPDFIWLSTKMECRYTMERTENPSAYLNHTSAADYCLWFNDTKRNSFMLPIESLKEIQPMTLNMQSDHLFIYKIKKSKILD